MKTSRFRSILILLGILILAWWCYFKYLPRELTPPEESAAEQQDHTDTMIVPTLTPAMEEIDSVCEVQDEVRVEGFLHVPDSVSCVTKDDGEYCTVQLTDFITRNDFLISLPVSGERETPVSNHMIGLPIPYDTEDFMVMSDEGEWIGEGSIVRVTGRTESFGYIPSEGYGCKLVDINKVEKLDQFSLANDQARKATLRAAVKEGWVEIAITGDGLNRIDLKIEPKVNFNLNLEVEVGTIFESEAADVQNMVVRKKSFVYVTPEVEAEIELEVSCANMNKKEPGRENTFTVLDDLAPQDLINLINLAEFAFEPMRIQQFSVWTITDNPPRDGYVGISVSFSSEGSGPSDSELGRIKELFLEAGLDIDKYNALQE